MKNALRLGWTINIFYEKLNNWYILEMTHPSYFRYIEYIFESEFYEVFHIIDEHARYMDLKHPILERL